MAGSKEQQEKYMPMSNVVRIMRKALPAHAKISDDAKETMQDCVSEFISFITDEANDRCKREHRKTVTPEDVIWALGSLGYDDYVQPLSLYLQRYRESEGVPAYVRRRNRGLLNVMPPPPPPPPPQPPSGFYGYYGYGGPMLDFDPSQQTLTPGFKDDASASVSAVASASASASASGSGSSVATFDSLRDKGDPM